MTSISIIDVMIGRPSAAALADDRLDLAYRMVAIIAAFVVAAYAAYSAKNRLAMRARVIAGRAYLTDLAFYTGMADLGRLYTLFGPYHHDLTVKIEPWARPDASVLFWGLIALDAVTTTLVLASLPILYWSGAVAFWSTLAVAIAANLADLGIAFIWAIIVVVRLGRDGAI
ncbi:MAG TPA: hypothetical protein VJ783_04995 [Pirellulales bacterium]|nr:hypothetical protein [Pirellulales bacterium]